MPARLSSPRSFLLLLSVILVLLFGCSDGTDAIAEEQTVVDDLGRTVSWYPPVERIVTLAPSVTELVFAAGGGTKLVGVTTADTYPPAVDTLARFSSLPLDFESIASLEPDLALAAEQVNAPRDTETFDALGIPVYFLSTPSLDAVFENIRSVGALLGTEDRAKAAADSLERATAMLRGQTEDLDHRPLVLFLVGDETLYAFGEASHIHQVIELAGGRSATADLAAQAPTLSDEFVLTAEPDVIVGAFGEDYDPDRLLELHPTWDVVPAVQSGRVYSLNPDLVLRPGPRLVEAAWQIARYLHPDRIEEHPGEDG